MIPSRLPLTDRAAPSGLPRIVGATALDRRRRERNDARFIEWAQHLVSALRSGQPVAPALTAAVDEAPELAPPGARRAVADMRHGRGQRRSLTAWRDQARSAGERMTVVALLVAVDRGTEAAPAIETVIQSMRDDAALRSKQRVLTAQARASALVLVTLPVGFGVFSSVLRGELIYRGSAGLAIVGVGLLLDLAGFTWMRRLRRRLL